MYKIYKLIYKGEVCYIGITKNSLSRRKNQGYLHIPFYKDCEIVLIEETDDRNRESFYIEKYKNEGHNLLNIQDGFSGKLNKDYSRIRNKELDKESGKRFRDNNPDYMIEYNRKWHEANKEQRNAYQRERYKQKKLTQTL